MAWLCNQQRYVEGRVDVLHKVVNVVFVLAQEFVDLLEALVERPEAQLVKAGVLDFVDGEELFVVLGVTPEEARLARQASALLALRVNADI